MKMEHAALRAALLRRAEDRAQFTLHLESLSEANGSLSQRIEAAVARLETIELDLSRALAETRKLCADRERICTLARGTGIKGRVVRWLMRVVH